MSTTQKPRVTAGPSSQLPPLEQHGSKVAQADAECSTLSYCTSCHGSGTVELHKTLNKHRRQWMLGVRRQVHPCCACAAQLSRRFGATRPCDAQQRNALSGLCNRHINTNIMVSIPPKDATHVTETHSLHHRATHSFAATPALESSRRTHGCFAFA